MANLIVPLFAQAQTAAIVIDGVTYRVPLIDAAGHLQVDVLTSGLPSGAATAAHQATMITALELIDDLRGALAAVAADQLRTDVISSALPSGAATSAKQDTMITALQLIDNLITALATVGTDQLRTDVISTVLPALAATSTKQDTMITALQLIDDLRGALAAVGTDRLNVNVKAAGASEVKSAFARTTDPSNTRMTLATPASGKAIRIVSCGVSYSSTTASRVEVYFGTGANITTNAGKEIMNPNLDSDVAMNAGMVWPDGGGPVGDADEVVSLRTGIEVGTAVGVIIQYREE